MTVHSGSAESKKRDVDQLDEAAVPNDSRDTSASDVPVDQDVQNHQDKKIKTETGSTAAPSTTTTTTTTSTTLSALMEEDDEDGDDDQDDEDEDKPKKQDNSHPNRKPPPVAPPMLSKEELTELQNKTRVTTSETRKKKVAICLGYSGTNYKGMQKNPGLPTIEEELEMAIFKTGGILPDNMYSHRKIDWIRCARTDKGVSAVRNMVSCKLECEPPSLEEMRAAINSHLPPDIHIFGIKRVNNTFHAKNCVDRRSYIYVTPTYAFQPLFATNKPDNYVFDERERKRINNVLALYNGTHRYHNFTSRKESHEPSAVRTINSFVCSEPFELEGTQWVQINIVGQSFMLHQIRKMIGVVMQLMRKGIFYDSESDEVALATISKMITATFAHRSFNLPMAPGAGLLLDRCIFDVWAQKFSKIHGDLMFDDAHDEVEKFKMERIFKEIALVEKETNLFKVWFADCLDPYPLPYDELIATFNNPPAAPPRAKRVYNDTPKERVPVYRQFKHLGNKQGDAKDKTTTTTPVAQPAQADTTATDNTTTAAAPVAQPAQVDIKPEHSNAESSVSPKADN
eukprot:gene2474-2815_t